MVWSKCKWFKYFEILKMSDWDKMLKIFFSFSLLKKTLQYELNKYEIVLHL